MLDYYYQVNEKTLGPLCGRAVCVIMNDETRHTGILTSCGPNTLTLNGERTLRPDKRKRSNKVNVKAGDTIAAQKQVVTTPYWGTLSIEPLIDRSSVKAVIPLTPIKAIGVF